MSFVKANALIHTYLKTDFILFLWRTNPLVWNHKECVIHGSQINIIFRWKPDGREYKDRRQFSTLNTSSILQFKIIVNNLNMKLQGRISACLTVDRNIISKIIFLFPANPILELYNTWLQRHLEQQVVYLEPNSKMHAIAWFICCFEACYPHWRFIQENIKKSLPISSLTTFERFLKHCLTQYA